MKSFSTQSTGKWFVVIVSPGNIKLYQLFKYNTGIDVGVVVIHFAHPPTYNTFYIYAINSYVIFFMFTLILDIIILFYY